MRCTQNSTGCLWVLAFCAAIARTAAAAAAPADWVFHPFPKANRPVNEVAALGDTLFMEAGFGQDFFRSTDHGQTWQSQDTALNGSLYNVKVFGAEVFMFGDTGIRRSRDRGANWVPAHSGIGNVMVESMFEIGQVLYAVAATGFYRSANRGDSWTRVKAPLEPQAFSMAEVQGTLYFSCITLNQDSALFRSNDNGLTWSLSPTPSEDLIWVDKVESHGGFLFLTSSGAVYRSRPDSTGWTRVGNPGTPAIWHWQSEGNAFHAFGRNGAFHSDDTGMTWIRDTPTDTIPEISVLWWKGARMLGSISKVYDLVESKDFGATWTKLNQPYDILPRVALHSSDPNLIAHTPGKSVFTTSDFGLSWTQPSGDLSAMTVLDGLVFAMSGYGELRQSTTHGTSWSPGPIATRLPGFSGLLAGGAGSLYATVTAGDSIYRRPANFDARPWQACPAPVQPPRSAGVRYFAKMLATGAQVYVLTWDGRWQYSLDTANTWNPVPASLQSAGPRDVAGQGVVLSGTNHGLYRSADSGKTWNPVTAPAQPGLGDTLFSVLRRGNAFFAGGRGRVYYSLDDGLTWGSTGPATFEGNVDAMEVQGGRLALIAPGAGIWSGPLPAGYAQPVGISAPGASGEPALAEAGFRLKSGVLRPGDKVEWRLPEPGPARLSLYSAAGNRLADLYAGNLAAGSHSLVVDPASLGGVRAGFYLLHLKAGTRFWTMRVVLQP